jgi:hypothetical protein
MSDKVTEFFKQYDEHRITDFLFAAFGKYRYVHTLSEKGLDCYLSNLRSVSNSHPDDMSCVIFYIGSNRFSLVDYKDPDIFIDTFKKHLALKAFI